MSSNILLYTAEKVSGNDLSQKARNISAVDISEINETRFCLTRSEQVVWFSLDLSIKLDEDEILRVQKIIDYLPQSCINIEIRRLVNAERLAAELANYLLQYYQGIVFGIGSPPPIYSSQNIAKMLVMEQVPDFFHSMEI
jgi:hypothetical protein